jgi:hypothetical protein
MTTLIKLFYAGAITALLVMLVGFGIRTFYEAPEEPQYPSKALSLRLVSPTGAPEQPSSAELQALEEEQRRYQEAYEAYSKERADYRRNVFLIASLFGVVAVAGGLVLPGRLDAIRLGLVAGGLGALLYAVIQADGDLDDFGSTVAFLVALTGLALILGAGYRWLAAPSEPAKT